MAPLQSYQGLRVWQQAMLLAEICYRHTTVFPQDELFGLTSQIRRAAASIPANIAEGWGREGTKEFIQFLRQAQGSLNELETHIILAQRLRYFTAELARDLHARIEAVGKMLYG